MTENQLYLLSVLLGQMMPPLTDVINKHISNSKVRFWISVVFSALIALAINSAIVIKLQWSNVDQILTTALLLWGSGQAAYKTYYENSKLQSSIRFNTKII